MELSTDTPRYDRFFSKYAIGDDRRKREILIVDDEPVNLSILSKVLTPYFVVRVCKSGEDALRNANIAPYPDLVLLDIMMPGMDGYEVLARMRENGNTRDIPVIFLSSLNSDVDEEKGLLLGAVDYITKPFKPIVVLARVRSQMEFKEARELLKNQNEWLEAEVDRRLRENQLIQDISLVVIAQLVETRDTETANHIVRTRSYVELLARRLISATKFQEGTKDRIDVLVKASPLHDIGKIGIPDSILLKPGPLTPEEFEIMKTHTNIGGNAIRNAIDKTLLARRGGFADGKPMSLRILEEAETIARFHHERWDGTGYPDGLKGEAIPLSARIMALADVFDALTSDRPYKSAWSAAEANAYIIEQRGSQFDPDVVDAFESELEEFAEIHRALADD